MSSRRLPGKVLKEIDGIPVLGHCILRCRQSQADKIVVATSEHATDDVLVEVAAQFDAETFRGPLDDVLERFRLLAKYYSAEKLIRINGDSPFVDPTLINHAIELSLQGNYDLVSNVHPRSFPKGQSVELLTQDLLESLRSYVLTEEHREHVTKYVYQNPSMFRILNFSSGGSFESIQLSVDTPEDLDDLRHLAKGMNGKVGSWIDIATQTTSSCE
jgi:spore coat polysaccharide biosynthesis protein SpsF